MQMLNVLNYASLVAGAWPMVTVSGLFTSFTQDAVDVGTSPMDLVLRSNERTRPGRADASAQLVEGDSSRQPRLRVGALLRVAPRRVAVVGRAVVQHALLSLKQPVLIAEIVDTSIIIVAVLRVVHATPHGAKFDFACLIIKHPPRGRRVMLAFCQSPFRNGSPRFKGVQREEPFRVGALRPHASNSARHRR